MSKYLGDFSATSVIDFKFTTFRPSTGAPFTLAGTPAVSVYKDNDITQSTAGVTLTVDFDGVTGLHHVRITTASDATFYANGGEFECVITTGTVDAVSVVGSCIGRFTLRSQASLYPTTAGNTLDVNANGEAGIDWANVGGQATTVGLANTTIAVTQQIASVSGSVNSVATRVTANTDQWNGTGVTGMPMPTYTQPTGFLTASFPTTVASTTNITAGTITNVGTVTGNVNGNVAGSVNSVATAVTVGTINANVVNASALATDAVTEIWNKAVTDSSYGASSTYTMLDVLALLGKGYCAVYGTVSASPPPTPNGCKTSLTGYINSAFDDQTIIFLQGGNVSGSCTLISSSNASGTLTFDEPLHQAPNVGDAFMILPMHVHLRGAIADKMLGRSIAAGADGGRMVKDALRTLRNKSAIVGSTLTVYQEDDATTAWTASVSSSATADPVTGIDPA